jgi:hypothetical protein
MYDTPFVFLADVIIKKTKRKEGKKKRKREVIAA